MDPRTKKTKQALLDGLFRLLKSKPIDELTVTQLSEESGINRRTFYLHYDNIIEVFNEYEAELSHRVNHILASPQFKVDNLVQIFDQIFDENLAGLTNPCINHRQQRLLQELDEMLFTVLLKSRTANPSPTDIITTHYTSSGIVNVYVYWVNNRNAFTRQQLSETMAKLVHTTLA